jgi:hypothetical protein
MLTVWSEVCERGCHPEARDQVPPGAEAKSAGEGWAHDRRDGNRTQHEGYHRHLHWGGTLCLYLLFLFDQLIWEDYRFKTSYCLDAPFLHPTFSIGKQCQFVLILHERADCKALFCPLLTILLDSFNNEYSLFLKQYHIGCFSIFFTWLSQIRKSIVSPDDSIICRNIYWVSQ